MNLLKKYKKLKLKDKEEFLNTLLKDLEKIVCFSFSNDGIHIEKKIRYKVSNQSIFRINFNCTRIYVE